MLRNFGFPVALALMLAIQAGAQESAESTKPANTPQPPVFASGRQHISRQDRDAARRAFLEGARDIQREDPRAAMEAFGRAANLDPNNRRYGLAQEIARQHLVSGLVQQADKAKILGHLDQSRADIAEAMKIDPRNPIVAQHADELATSHVAGEPVLQQQGLAAPIELKPKPGRQSFHIEASEREIARQVLQAFGIQPTIDDSVGGQRVRYVVDNVDFAEAERTLALATGTFLVPLDPARALVARDSRDNRAKFERQAVETVYLPGMSTSEIAEMVTMARNLFAARTVSPLNSESAIMIRAAVPDLTAFNSTIANLLEGRSELQLDVRMYEVDRTKAVDLGMILPQQTTLFNVYSEASSLLQTNSGLVQQIISSGLAAPGDWEAILAILVASGQVTNTILAQPFGTFGGGLSLTGLTFTGGSVNMKLNSSDVRSIDQMQLRVLDQEDATIRSGERYPIITSNYSSLSGSGLSIPGLSNPGLSSSLQNLGVNLSSLQAAATEAIPQVQYQDIGLTLKVTPHIQGPKDVALKFNLQLSSLAGASENDLPILNNRQYEAFTSLKIGQSAVLVSALSRQESDAITGVPGLSDIPGFQNGTNKNTSFNYSELAIVITPHIVRSVHVERADKMIPVPHQR